MDPREREQLERDARKPAEESLRLHPLYKGKIQMMPKCPVRSLEDFALWYTPGVAAPCRAIHASPELVYEHTNKGNTIAIVTDGTRVLGLGDIGPEAGLPVMEGKALLFKYLGGIDAIPICLATRDAGEIVRTVRLLEPSFGAINLEDIAQPKCFRILDELRDSMRIPVWHDDQQGTATVVLAALTNALAVVGKSLGRVKIAMIGFGAANVATYRLLCASGIDRGGVIACDTKGTLHAGRGDVELLKEDFADKWRVCCESNAERVIGDASHALRGADVCIAFAHSGPDVIRPEWVRAMAKDAIVFACGNPVPEIWPWDAKEAGARVIATGRGDFPNQLNNSLAFPGIFRGVLDVRARSITDAMTKAAAEELARVASERGLREDAILPRMDDPDVAVRVAVATAMKAQADGLARTKKTADELRRDASSTIAAVRETLALLVREERIRPMPPR